MHWLIFALAAVVLLSISNVLQRVLMKDNKSDPYAYGVLFQLFCSFMLFVFAIINGFHMPPVTQLPLNFVLDGVLYGLATLFLFKALHTIESSEATIITSSRSIVTVIVAVLLLGERFVWQYAVGVLLIISSVVLVNWSRKKIRLKSGMVFAGLASLCFGLAIANDAYILRYTQDAVSYAAIAFLLPSIVLFAMKPKVVSDIRSFFRNKKAVKNMIIMSTFYSLASIAVYVAIAQGAQVSQIGPVTQSSAIVTVALAVVFLKERDKLLRKVIAALLVFAGVLFLR